jgi:hypothetical protein
VSKGIGEKPREKEGRFPRQLAPLAHPGRGYPLSGCVPAEPDSVSPRHVHYNEKDKDCEPYETKV